MVKKCFLVGLSCLTVIGGNNLNAFATKDYQVYVAVFCDDKEKAKNMINLLCREKGVFEATKKRVCFNGEENNIGKNDFRDSTVIYDEYEDTNYHIKYKYLNKLDKSILKKCSRATILYDISDETLNPIVNTVDLASNKNIKNLLSLETPLVKYINKLQYKNWWLLGGSGWYNSLDFASYGKEKLQTDEYDTRRSQINRFTCQTEKYFKVDNKWERGHSDISQPDFYEYDLFGIVGSARRSIMDGSVSGEYNSESNTLDSNSTENEVSDNEEFKKKPNNYKKLILGTAALAAICAMLYGGYRLFKGDGNYENN